MTRHRFHAAIATTVLAGLGAAATAGASPWNVSPNVGLSADYQSNPAFAPGGGPSASQASLRFALPAQWTEGRYSAGLGVAGQIRTTTGNVGLGDSSDVLIDGRLARASERLDLSLTAGLEQTNLLGGTAQDVGLFRSGVERGKRATVGATWAATEYDVLSLSGNHAERRFVGGASAALQGSRTDSAVLGYSRAVTPALRITLSGSRQRFDLGAGLGQTEATSAQVGFAYRPSELWSVQVSGGRSWLADESGVSRAPGTVYDAAASRAFERGSLSLTASQSLQASAFGSVEQVRRVSASYGFPISPRTVGSVSADRLDSRQVLAGFDLFRRKSASATASVSRALTEVWSLGLGVTYTRETYPPTFFRTALPSASSVSASLSLSRQLGPTAFFR